MDRRSFLKISTAAAMAAALPSGADVPARNGIPYRVLGRTGVEVSCLGVGGAHIGRIDEAEGIRVMRTAVDEGVNFFDNAWAYNDGVSEERMGKALKDGYRDKVFLMTKSKERDVKVAREQMETSLRRLQVDVIDLWQFHEVIRPEEPQIIYTQGLIEMALKAKEEGKIKHIGFTGHHITTTHRDMISRGFEWATVQMPINAFDYHFRSFEQRVLPMAVESNIGVIAMKTMGHGELIKTGVVTPEECLRYALALPVSTVCCGMDSVEMLQQNLKTVREAQPMAEAEKQTLLAKTAPLAADGKYEIYKTEWSRDIEQQMRAKGIEPA